MGFMDAMKGANMNFGTVDSPDFMACYLTQKGDHFMITGAQAGTYEFTKDDIKEFKVVISGTDFIKWKMEFKDGKIAIITSGVKNPNEKSSGISMAPIERFFGDLLTANAPERPSRTVPVKEEVSTPAPSHTEVEVEKGSVVEPPKATEKPADGKYAELVELKKLVDAGIISQQDYELKKNKILGIEEVKKPSNRGGTALFILSLIFSGLALIMCLLCVFFGLFKCVWIENSWRMTLFGSLFSKNPTTGFCWYFFISYLVATALAATILAFVLKKKNSVFNLCLSILGLPVTIVCGILSMANYTRDFYWTDVHHEIEFRWPILVNGIFIFVAVLFFTIMVVLSIISVVKSKKK